MGASRSVPVHARQLPSIQRVSSQLSHLPFTSPSPLEAPLRLYRQTYPARPVTMSGLDCRGRLQVQWAVHALVKTVVQHWHQSKTSRVRFHVWYGVFEQHTGSVFTTPEGSFFTHDFDILSLLLQHLLRLSTLHLGVDSVQRCYCS